MVLTFNSLLRTADIDPAGVLLLRHCDPQVQRQVYGAAIERDARFEDYQRSQVVPKVIAAFERTRHLAGFVVDAAGACVFAGLWDVLGRSDDVYRAPFAGMREDGRQVQMFTTRRVEVLDQYRGKLVIDWGDGQRAWMQRAHLRTKPIVEIRQEISEPSFPGFLRFSGRLSEIEALPRAWVAALRSTGGVYLLVHRERAHLYVGSATGVDGFFGRWASYRDGHGGNVGLQEIQGSAEDYTVSILETAGSGLDDREVLTLEAIWKEKLASRLHGLNRN